MRCAGRKRPGYIAQFCHGGETELPELLPGPILRNAICKSNLVGSGFSSFGPLFYIPLSSARSYPQFLILQTRRPEQALTYVDILSIKILLLDVFWHLNIATLILHTSRIQIAQSRPQSRYSLPTWIPGVCNPRTLLRFLGLRGSFFQQLPAPSSRAEHGPPISGLPEEPGRLLPGHAPSRGLQAGQVIASLNEVARS